MRFANGNKKFELKLKKYLSLELSGIKENIIL